MCNSDLFTILLNSVFFISFVYITVSLIFDIFNYLDSQISRLFTQVPKSPDNRGSTVLL